MENKRGIMLAQRLFSGEQLTDTELAELNPIKEMFDQCTSMPDTARECDPQEFAGMLDKFVKFAFSSEPEAVAKKRRIYQARNKGSNRILIVATDEDIATKAALRLKFVRTPENLRLKDITEEYVGHHGVDLQSLEMDDSLGGQLGQIINGNHSSWTVHS